MPVIDLPEEPPLPGANTLFGAIFAVMLYPRSDKQRHYWYAAHQAGAYAFWCKEGATQEVLSDFHAWIGVLWELPQSPQRVFRDGMDRISRAALSGHVLLYLLQTAKHHPQHCTVERATALVVQFAPRKGKTISESLVQKSWAEFKSASHLWAAFVYLVAKKQYPGSDNSEWLAFLGRAETYRKAAAESRLLNRTDTWRTPEGCVVPPTETDLNPIDKKKLAFLDREFPG